jgi:hypothetical protein
MGDSPVQKSRKIESSVSKKYAAPKTEFIEIRSRRFFGEGIKSPNGRFTLAWKDANNSGSVGGHRLGGKGRYLLIDGKGVLAQGAIDRPNDGKVANNGTFILNDWGFGDELGGVFWAFDRSGKNLVNRRFEANLFNCGLSADGAVAVCQTCNAYEGEDGSKLTIFDLRTGVEVASWIPVSGWADFYAFPKPGVIQLGYTKLGLFSYAWDGEFIDRERWQEARLARGDYSNVMMAVEFALKENSCESDQGLAVRLLDSLNRISSTIPSSDSKAKAREKKLRGQCMEFQGDLSKALLIYDEALTLDPKVGIKRRADQIRKQLAKTL